MKVSASENYMQKEEVRQAIYNVLEDRIASRKINNQAELEDFWKTVEMASRALRAIPFDAFKKVLSMREVKEMVKDILDEVENS